jgi:hypothetical protein
MAMDTRIMVMDIHTMITTMDTPIMVAIILPIMEGIILPIMAVVTMTIIIMSLMAGEKGPAIFHQDGTEMKGLPDLQEEILTVLLMDLPVRQGELLPVVSLLQVIRGGLYLPGQVPRL